MAHLIGINTWLPGMAGLRELLGKSLLPLYRSTTSRTVDLFFASHLEA